MSPAFVQHPSNQKLHPAALRTAAEFQGVGRIGVVPMRDARFASAAHQVGSASEH